MNWSVNELTDIRSLVGELLDDIGLHSFVFNVEQDQKDWIVSVDFPRHDEWQAVVLRVDKEAFRDCLEHGEARENLRTAWKNRLNHLA